MCSREAVTGFFTYQAASGKNWSAADLPALIKNISARGLRAEEEAVGLLHRFLVDDLQLLFGQQGRQFFKTVTSFTPKKKIVDLFLWRTKHVFSSLENARFHCHTSLELWKQYDFRARCCWSTGGPVKKCLTHHERMPQFAVKHAWNYKQDRRAVVSSASKPTSESIRRVSVCSSSKNETRDLSGGLRGFKLEVKASHMLSRGLHPTKPGDHLLSSE